MVFTKRLREGIRRGRIRCSIRIWMRPHVKTGGRYPMDDGQIEVDSIEPMAIGDITHDLARESGFDSVKDLLEIAKHGRGDRVYLIRFHYLPPGAWSTRPGGTNRTRKMVRSRKKTGFDAVREIARALPGVVEGTTYGSPAVFVAGKMFACIAVNRSAEPNSLVVRMDVDQRDELIDAEPETYYLTDHYVDYPCVLVRLARVREDALRDLLLMGWRFVSATKNRRARKSP
jgi:hypothetical protein